MASNFKSHIICDLDSSEQGACNRVKVVAFDVDGGNHVFVCFYLCVVLEPSFSHSFESLSNSNESTHWCNRVKKFEIWGISCILSVNRCGDVALLRCCPHGPDCDSVSAVLAIHGWRELDFESIGEVHTIISDHV